jgi:hypothetical protein
MDSAAQTSSPASTDCGAAPTTAVWSVREHAPLPAQALGPKAKTLHLRRRQQCPRRPPRGSATSTQTRLTGSDAALSFVLSDARPGLFVQRTQHHTDGMRLIQSMVFDTAREFDRWCHAEPLRFHDPTLHQRVVAFGADFFDERA